MEIRPVTQDDIVAVYGRPLPFTVRGFAGVLDEEVIGVAGIMFARPPQAFCKFTIELKPYRRELIRGIRMLRKLLNEQAVPVYATPDEDAKETADGFLKFVGFKATEQMGVYVWHH